MRFTTLFRALLIGSFWAALSAQSSGEQQLLTVTLRSGRILEAYADEKTDDAELWLRTERGGMRVLRPVRWEEVVRVRSDEQTYDSTGFAEYLATHPIEESQGEEVEAPGEASTPEEGGLFLQSSSDGFTPSSPRIRVISLVAGLGSWDADVESDGLIVVVKPMDAFGNRVVAAGTAEINLIGMRRGTRTLRENFPPLGRWTRSIRSAEATPDGFVLQLPFTTVHPEFALDVAPHGLVHVRFTAPGHGVFEASESMTRIRPYSAFRDRAQQVLDRRFLPIERTGGGQSAIRYGHF